MPRTPQRGTRELIQFLKSRGFVEDGQPGNHLTLWSEARQAVVTIPVHTGTSLDRGLVERILSDARFSVDDYLEIEPRRRGRRASSSQTDVYQLRLMLEEIEPPIWRRLQVPGSMALDRLHAVIQAAMGWQDYHLHQFEIGDRCYGVPEPKEPDYAVDDERLVRLRDAAPVAGAMFRYIYDLGDHWSHEIVVEQIDTYDRPLRHAVCLAGARSRPPEDCGGVGGYEEFLEVIRDPDHEEHEAMLRWAGGRFEPEAFNLAAVNRKLRVLR